MIKISDFKINVLEKTETLPAIFERRLHLPAGTLKSFSVLKESIDARKKPQVFKVYSFVFDIDNNVADSDRNCSACAGSISNTSDLNNSGSDKNKANNVNKINQNSILQLCKKNGIKAELYVMPDPIAFPDLSYLISNKDVDLLNAESNKNSELSNAALSKDSKASQQNHGVYALKHNSLRPIVVGFGPCGMFASLSLAKMGLKPIILERGPKMDERVKAVENFWNTGELNPNANCQFGEGGAGTFSDGKLTTGTKSVYQHFVLEEFVKMGADPAILYKQKPHIGTDVLRNVVVNLRKEIESLGGEFKFNTKLEKIYYKDSNLSVSQLSTATRSLGNVSTGETSNVFNNTINDPKDSPLNDSNSGILCAVLEGGEVIEASAIVLALGHSARDTIRTLFAEGLDMEQKQFSMGLRIEHPQEVIDKSQYGVESSKLGLGPSDYKLNVKTSDGRGVYTFCMCPGGVVVNASSQEGCITCNGMSYFKRDSGKANSALLADVRTSDFNSSHPLAGIEFQEKYEKLAFELSCKMYKNMAYKLPSEKLSDFVTASQLKECLPDFVYESLTEAIPMLGQKLNGFDDPNSLLYALESRSSSPVRITRSDNGFAFSKGRELPGIYPAGEGAGYAGGIMSAACDGVRIAFKIAEYISDRI